MKWIVASIPIVLLFMCCSWAIPSVSSDHVSFIIDWFWTIHRLEQLRSSCLGVFPSLYMPTTRNEDYRFTDLSPVLKSDVHVGLQGGIFPNLCDVVNACFLLVGPCV